MVGVETGVFLCGLEDEVDVAFGIALPERICRFGEPSAFVVTGPTDWERPMRNLFKTLWLKCDLTEDNYL